MRDDVLGSILTVSNNLSLAEKLVRHRSDLEQRKPTWKKTLESRVPSCNNWACIPRGILGIKKTLNNCFLVVIHAKNVYRKWVSRSLIVKTSCVPSYTMFCENQSMVVQLSSEKGPWFLCICCIFILSHVLGRGIKYLAQHQVLLNSCKLLPSVHAQPTPQESGGGRRFLRASEVGKSVSCPLPAAEHSYPARYLS